MSADIKFTYLELFDLIINSRKTEIEAIIEICEEHSGYLSSTQRLQIINLLNQIISLNNQ